jgi:DNA-3-methyladenine glycosylase I
MQRCDWASAAGDDAMTAYHDTEWGVPSHDDRHLFELLVLEGAQAGLSWATILHKREGYRRAFAGFDPRAVARFDDGDVERLLADPGIVRNGLKIRSAIANASAVLRVSSEHGSLDAYLWSLGGDASRNGGRDASTPVPSETEGSRAMSRELKRRGFRFVGPTICYAFMQAAGMVNDHEARCFRFAELERVD